MGQSIASIIIVGGGSAGWLSALVLSTYCPFASIKLIRPKINKPIGVGESTQPDLPQRVAAAGINVEAFYRASNATMKCGIFYRDWNVVGDQYWHPFTDMADNSTYTAAHHYQQLILEDPARYTHAGYYAAVHTSYDTCVRRSLVAPEAATALHIDAAKAAQFLEKALTTVELIEADTIDAMTEGGRISGIKLDSGKTVSADLYIDCTGFARALSGKVAPSPKILPWETAVNRAATADVPYVGIATDYHAYTKVHAHEQGWTWSIPLQERIGTGYVYHGDFCTPDQAERNLRAYWGEERMRDVKVRHISFANDILREPWVENVVTIGLSAGFIEPLEATGLNWTISCADLLSRFICARYIDEDMRIKYNALMTGYIHDVQDFVDVHYKLSARRDSEFWRYQTSRAYPERLEHRLAMYATEMPSARNRVKSFAWAFNEVSWLDILNGYDFKYRRLQATAEERRQAELALGKIATSPRKALDPRSLQPV